MSRLRPPHHDQGTGGGGLDSNFIHPIMAYYELHNTKAYTRLEDVVLKSKLGAKEFLYPVSNHHLLEDVDTMWDLYFTHVLPAQWWLSDRVECVGPPKARWAKGNRKPKVPKRLSDIHVELMGRDYESARYALRSQEAAVKGERFHHKLEDDAFKGRVYRMPYDEEDDDESDPTGDDLPASRNSPR